MVSYDEEDEDSDIFGESDREEDDDDDDEDNTEVSLLGLFLNICPLALNSDADLTFLLSEHPLVIFCQGTGSPDQRRRRHQSGGRSCL